MTDENENLTPSDKISYGLTSLGCFLIIVVGFIVVGMISLIY